jgi:phage protein D
MPEKVNTFELKIKGKKDLTPFIREVTYTEAVGELDGMTCTLMFSGDGMDEKKVTSLMEPGLPFTLDFLEGSAPKTKREGDIIAVSYYRRRHSIQVTLIGVNYLHRLRSEHITQIWEDPHSKIVKTIAGRAKPSLTAKVQGVSSTADFTFQQSETDAVFLMRLAREHNYFCRVVGKELHFGRRDLAYGSPVTLVWGEDLLEIRMTANLKDHLNEVHVFWGDAEKDGTKQTKVKYTKAPKPTNSGGKMGSALGKKNFGKKVAVIGGVDMPFYKNQSEAKAKAQAELDASAMDFIEGIAHCHGIPEAACGAKLTIKKAAWPFEGTFVITKVEHRANREGAMFTDITFKANSLPKN